MNTADIAAIIWTAAGLIALLCLAAWVREGNRRVQSFLDTDDAPLLADHSDVRPTPLAQSPAYQPIRDRELDGFGGAA